MLLLFFFVRIKGAIPAELQASFDLTSTNAYSSWVPTKFSKSSF